MICLLAAVLAAVPPDTAAATRNEMLPLTGCRIELQADAPRTVRRAVEDLQSVLERVDGQRPQIQASSQTRHATGEPLIRVGVARPDGDEATPEEFSLEVSARKPMRIDIRATDSSGLKFGVIELIRRLEIREQVASIPTDLHIRRKPRFAIRGMYAHLHWSYNRPYALRSWELQDWKRYIDLLTHLGFNTLQIWPMMELLPHPLSAEDAAYLQRYAEIVRYAREERGMRVFIGSCPNNITEDARGVPIAEREYFEFEKRLDPADPGNLQRILDFRSDLYRTVKDADGYWMIDGDPGGWKGSPSSDFVNILRGHRALIDQYGRHSPPQPLIYWMWYSWGTGTREENWRNTLRDMKERLPEPWLLHACLPGHLDALRELNLLQKAIYFPYNLVETEPSAPLTELRFGGVSEAARITSDAKLRGLLGNAQTPLAQLPNIAALAAASWGESPASQSSEVLRDLARQIAGPAGEELAHGWELLTSTDTDEVTRAAARLREIARDLPDAGLSLVLGDWRERIVGDLATMLDIHAGALRFAHATSGRPQNQAEALAGYLAVTAGWLERTGYHGVRVVDHEAYRHTVARALEEIGRQIGSERLESEIVAVAVAAAARDHSPEIVRLIVGSLLRQRK